MTAALDQRATYCRTLLGSVTPPKVRENRLLSWKVLIQRRYIHAGSIGDEVIDRLAQSLERDEMQRLSDRLKAQSDRLAAAIRSVIADAIAAGGSSLRDYVRPDGELGYFSKEWRVYGREGLPCPHCGATIRRQVDSGRSTFSCPKCQR